MKYFLLLMTLATLTACGTLEGKIDNRVVCTVAKDKAYNVSEYGNLGISNKISDLDRAVICK